MLECLIRLYHVLLKGFSPPISVFPCPLAWHFGHCYYRSYNLSWEDQLVFARTRLTMDSHASNLSKGNSPGSESARAGVGLNEAEQQGSLGPQLRLIARGSSPVEDHARYLGRRQPARSRNSIELNLSGAAKKRSGLPPRAAISAATVTPSPTTQIAAGMNSIALDKSPMGGPAPLLLPPASSFAADDREGGPRRSRTPQQADPERVGGERQPLEYMDTASRTHSGENRREHVFDLCKTRWVWIACVDNNLHADKSSIS